MRRATLTLACFAVVASASAQEVQRVDRAEHHEFVIQNFRTEGGVTLPEARIVYGTYGHLNAARDNAILLRVVATSGTAKTYPHGVVRLEGQIAALTADAAFNGGDYTEPPRKGLEAFAVVWTGWLFSQEWWRQELWKRNAKPGTTFEQVLANYRSNFLPGADANNLIAQMRTWEHHDVGGTPGFDGDVERALRSIRIPVLYMPSETDLYFPITDARYEAGLIPGVQFAPIPSLWGHPAGAAPNPEDARFLNERISTFLKSPR